MVDILKIKNQYSKNWGMTISRSKFFIINIYFGKRTWMITW
jgi:hypothetical protein